MTGEYKSTVPVPLDALSSVVDMEVVKPRVPAPSGIVAHISHEQKEWGVSHGEVIDIYTFARGKYDEFLPPGRYRLIPLEDK